MEKDLLGVLAKSSEIICHEFFWRNVIAWGRGVGIWKRIRQFRFATALGRVKFKLKPLVP